MINDMIGQLVIQNNMSLQYTIGTIKKKPYQTIYFIFKTYTNCKNHIGEMDTETRLHSEPNTLFDAITNGGVV